MCVDGKCSVQADWPEAPCAGGSAELCGLTEKDWTVPALVELLAHIMGTNPVLCAKAEAKARQIVATYYNA